MSDIVDTANDAAALFLADSLAHVPTDALSLTGTCHNYEEPVEAHFCDRECHRDYEYRMHIRRKQGLA